MAMKVRNKLLLLEVVMVMEQLSKQSTLIFKKVLTKLEIFLAYFALSICAPFFVSMTMKLIKETLVGLVDATAL